MKSFLLTLLLATLSSFKDQYDKPFNATLNDSIVIIYISGLEDPLTMGYDKLKDKIVSNSARVFIVGAFDNIPGGTGKINHIKSGFVSKYGKDYISVLLDAEGALGKSAKTDGLSIIILKKGGNQSIIHNYGINRIFF
jgi:hypothetical protein